MLRLKIFLLMILSFGYSVYGEEVTPYESGPVHEAYINPVTDSVVLQAIAYVPPKDITENIPASCDEMAIWIKGYFAWSQQLQDFVWVSGVWRRPPPGHVWIDGYWYEASSGYVWIRGFWSKQDERDLIYISQRPPDSLEEKFIDPPGKNYFWAPGYWNYSSSGRKYEWLSGTWSILDPEWIYVPAHYVWRPEGYILIPAYWDWPLEVRGCVYTPVIIDPAHRSVISYTPSVVLEPVVIIRYCFLYYPDYVFFFYHHWYYHPGFWDTWCCPPPWWWWDTCWCFNWYDTWWLYWWWCHPGFPHPPWITVSLSQHIPPPPNKLLDWIQDVIPPPIVQPWGVARPSDLIAAIKAVTGSDDPVMPSDPDQQSRVRDRLEPDDPDTEKPLHPTGSSGDIKTPLPRPAIEGEKPAPRMPNGSITIPPLPDRGDIKQPTPEAPPIIPPKPPTEAKPDFEPSYPPPSYQPPRYPTPRKDYPPRDTYPKPKPPSGSWQWPEQRPKPQDQDRERYPGEFTPRGDSGSSRSWETPQTDRPLPTIKKPFYRLREDVRDWIQDWSGQRSPEIQRDRNRQQGESTQYPDDTYK